MKRSFDATINVDDYKKLPTWATKENSKDSPLIIKDELEGEENANRERLPKWIRNPEAVEREEMELIKVRRVTKSMLQEQADAEEDENLASKYKFQEIFEPSSLMKGRTICFDLETTGFTREDCIIEIGAVEIVDGERSGVLFQSYIKPRKEIHPKAQEVHGMSAKKLAHAADVSVVVPKFMKWVGDSPLVAHNAKSTISETRRLIEGQDCNYYKKKFPKKAYSLNDAAVNFGVSFEHRTIHSALLDSEILGKVFIAESKSINYTTHNVWSRSGSSDNFDDDNNGNNKNNGRTMFSASKMSHSMNTNDSISTSMNNSNVGNCENSKEHSVLASSGTNYRGGFSNSYMVQSESGVIIRKKLTLIKPKELANKENNFIENRK